MDYIYNYNEYPPRQHYYSSYHPQILPSTLTNFENDLPFYSTTFGSAPTSYNGNIYFPPEPTPIGAGGYVPSQMIPTSLSTRFLMNDANNNSFGEMTSSLSILLLTLDDFQCLTMKLIHHRSKLKQALIQLLPSSQQIQLT
jgi:hypothetical protein